MWSLIISDLYGDSFGVYKVEYLELCFGFGVHLEFKRRGHIIGLNLSIVAKMAHDILESLVIAQSRLLAVGTAIDDTRLTLTFDIVEALLCLKDSLHSLSAFVYIYIYFTN